MQDELALNTSLAGGVQPTPSEKLSLAALYSAPADQTLCPRVTQRAEVDLDSINDPVAEIAPGAALAAYMGEEEDIRLLASTGILNRPFNCFTAEWDPQGSIYGYGEGDSPEADYSLEELIAACRVIPGSLHEQRGWIYPVPFLPYTQATGNYLWSYVTLHFTTSDNSGVDFQRAAYSTLPGMREPARSALHSFLVNLYAYMECVPEDRRCNRPMEVFNHCLLYGPAYAKTLDQYKARVVHRVLHAKLIEVDEDDPLLPTFTRAVGIEPRVSDIFRPNDLLTWEPPHLEWKGVVDVPVKIVPAVLEEFRQTCRNYLANPLIDWVPAEPSVFLQGPSGKKHRSGSWFDQEIPLEPASTRGVSRIAHVPRELKEARWAAVCDPAEILRIRWIDRQIQAILDLDGRNKTRQEAGTTAFTLKRAMTALPEFCYAQTFEEFEAKQLEGFKVGRCGYFRGVRMIRTGNSRVAYCRDLKKEGLMKPRELLRVMMEELHSRRPDMAAFEYPGFFDTWDIEVDGELVKTTRGHGLGMAVSLTTLMGLIICEMISVREPKLRPRSFGVYNDDQYAVFDDYATANRYAAWDTVLTKGLSLFPKAKSTFLSETGVVFMEQYHILGYPLFGQKPFFKEALEYLPMKAINASHARSLVGGLGHMSSNGLSRTFHYWGHVLYRSEMIRPSPLGGWFNFREKGVETWFLSRVSGSKLSREEDAAFHAVKDVKLIRRAWDKNPRTYVHPWLSEAPRDFLDALGVSPVTTADKYFRADLDRHENRRSWMAYQRSLRKVYNARISRWDRTVKAGLDIYPATVYDVYKHVASDVRLDVIPPRDLIVLCGSAEERYSNKEVVFSYPYGSQPLSICLNLWNRGQGNEYPLTMRQAGSLHIPACRTAPEVTSRATLERWTAERRMGHIKRLSPNLNMLRYYYDAWLVPPPEACSLWHNPFAVGLAADRILGQWTTIAPSEVDLPDEKVRLLARRSEYYGRDLLPEEWVRVGHLHPVNQVILHLWTHKRPPSVDELDEYIKTLERVPRLGYFAYVLPYVSKAPELGTASLWQYLLGVFREFLEKNHKRYTPTAPRDQEVTREDVDYYPPSKGGTVDELELQDFLGLLRAEEVDTEERVGVPECAEGIEALAQELWAVRDRDDGLADDRGGDPDASDPWASEQSQSEEGGDPEAEDPWASGSEESPVQGSSPEIPSEGDRLYESDGPPLGSEEEAAADADALFGGSASEDAGAAFWDDDEGDAVYEEDAYEEPPEEGVVLADEDLELLAIADRVPEDDIMSLEARLLGGITEGDLNDRSEDPAVEAQTLWSVQDFSVPDYPLEWGSGENPLEDGQALDLESLLADDTYDSSTLPRERNLDD